jgi:hypothetical protein
MRTLVVVAIASLAAAVAGAPESRAADATCWCNPVHPAVFDNRIHVRCHSSPGGDDCGQKFPKFKYFAFPTSSPIYKDIWHLLVAYATSASNDRPTRAVWIHFDPDDTTGAAWGCQASNCRKISWVEGG